MDQATARLSLSDNNGSSPQKYSNAKLPGSQVKTKSRPARNDQRYYPRKENARKLLDCNGFSRCRTTIKLFVESLRTKTPRKQKRQRVMVLQALDALRLLTKALSAPRSGTKAVQSLCRLFKKTAALALRPEGLDDFDWHIKQIHIRLSTVQGQLANYVVSHGVDPEVWRRLASTKNGSVNHQHADEYGQISRRVCQHSRWNGSKGKPTNNGCVDNGNNGTGHAPIGERTLFFQKQPVKKK